MSEEKTPAQVYTLPQEYVTNILDECDSQILVVSDLLRELLDEKATLYNKKTIMPLVSEIMWVNHSILFKLNVELNAPVYHHNKETKEDEHVFTERSIMDLQNLMITRFMAVNELNRFSRSVGLH